MNKEDKAFLIAMLIVCLENLGIFICFTILAIVFNKWWIVLISALFFTSFKTKERK